MTAITAGKLCFQPLQKSGRSFANRRRRLGIAAAVRNGSADFLI